MKRVFGILVCLVAILFLGSYPYEPIGFKEVPWGSPMKMFGNMPDYAQCSPVSNRYNIPSIGCALSKEKEIPQYMGKKVGRIVYIFHEGKQWAVVVHYANKADEKELLETFREFYGPGVVRGKNVFWEGNTTIIQFQFPDVNFVSAQVVKAHK